MAQDKQPDNSSYVYVQLCRCDHSISKTKQGLTVNLCWINKDLKTNGNIKWFNMYNNVLLEPLFWLIE